ncbi:MAG: Holliday junction resolvase RuvX [Eggerthellaceae bacterium]|nr:Holliday junction resolvase RuvX [Eggerthellaceae bacterium]
MRILALDIGDKRIGLAISDSAEKLSSPLKILPNEDIRSCSKNFKSIVEDWKVEKFLVGLPLSMSGESGKQVEAIKKIASNLQNHFPQILLEFYDERLSTKEAKQKLKAEGLFEKEMRGKLDALAAAIFLQAYIDAG